MIHGDKSGNETETDWDTSDEVIEVTTRTPIYVISPAIMEDCGNEERDDNNKNTMIQERFLIQITKRGVNKQRLKTKI